MSNELAIRSVSDLEAIGEKFESSGMFGCSQKGQGLVVAMTCATQGITPLEFIQTYHIIDGRPAMRADAMLARFVKSGGRFTIRERTEKRAAALFAIDGNELEAEYTIEEAERSGISIAKDGKSLKSNWAKFTKQMLWARLVSDSVRTLAPGVNMGAYTPEEVQDLGDEPAQRVVVPEPIRKRKAATGETAPQAESTQASTSTAAAPEVVAPEVMNSDFSVMPVGKFAGTKWADLDDVKLRAVLASNHAAFADGHKLAVQAELDKREQGKNA